MFDASLETPLTDLPTDSRSCRRAFDDLRDGFRHRQLWLHLGWQDIKQRYRRSVLGPFWITIATGVSAIAMGVLYGTLFNLDVPEFLPYVALGFIIWNLIQGSILEGADVFMSNEGLIKQLPTPLSVHVYRLVWRQIILFAHNIVIYIGIFIVFPRQLHWTALAAIPGLALIAINAVWVSLLFGILATRYRDIAPLLGSIVQLLFYMTPIIWTEETLAGTSNADRAKIAEINPLYHFLDIVRAPLLGQEQQLYHWGIVLAVTVVGCLVTLVAMRNYRSRVSYWV
jgi:ABC-2 type transport system permease protein